MVIVFVFTWLSLNDRLLNHLPKPYMMIQFTYRLITYVNLSIFAALVFAANRRQGFKNGVSAVLVSFCVSLSFAGILIKSVHSISSQTLNSAPQDPVHMPKSFYGDWNYATPSRFKTLTVEDQKNPSWIRTQVQIFPWNEIRVDDSAVSSQDMRVWSRSNVAVWVPQGRHTITYQFTPDRNTSGIRLPLACPNMSGAFFKSSRRFS
jgi:hypothetical protein